MKKLKKIGKILLIGFICFMALGYFASKSNKENKVESTTEVSTSEETQMAKDENNNVNVKVEDESKASQMKEEETLQNISTSSENKSTTLKELAYEKGYKAGLSRSNNEALDWYLKKQMLKKYYTNECIFGKLGQENAGNKELYEEFKRGFIQGHKDGKL